jgi:hypothetical protein
MFSIRALYLTFALACQAVLAPAVCHAFSITSVEVLPAGVITPSDPVSLVVGIDTPAQEPFLFDPTTLEQTGNTFMAEIFIDDGRLLPAIGHLDETLSLGTLAVGDYTYVINLTTAYDVNWGVRQVSGSFTVVPVPAPLLLLVSGLGTLAALRLRGRRRPR